MFTLDSFIEAVRYHKPHWELVASEETDSKVGNGHTAVFKVNKRIDLVSAAFEALEPQPVETVVIDQAEDIPPERVETIVEEIKTRRKARRKNAE